MKDGIINLPNKCCTTNACGLCLAKWRSGTGKT